MTILPVKKQKQEIRSKEYLAILQEARQWVSKTKDIIARMIQQGKKDGLSVKLIREDIDSLAERSGLSDRQKQRLLPIELKYTQFSNKPKLEADSQGEILLLAKFRTNNNNIIIEKIPAIPATIGAFLN